MPKVHKVIKARKAIPSIGVEVGDTYYWWKHRMKGSRSGFKKVSKTYPNRSRLTMSSYKQAVYAIQDRDTSDRNFDNLESIRDDYANELNELLQDQQDKLDSMPESLQESSVVQERIDALESAVADVENIDIPDVDEFDPESDGDLEAWKEEKVDSFYEEIESAIEQIDC